MLLPDKSVNRVSRPWIVVDIGRSWRSDGLIGPPGCGVSGGLFGFGEHCAGSNPCSQEFDLLGIEMFPVTSWRHADGIVTGANFLKQQALVGLPGNNRRPGFAAFMNAAAKIQTQSSGLFQSTVAGGAFLCQQRSDLLLVKVVGRGSLQDRCACHEEREDSRWQMPQGMFS